MKKFLLSVMIIFSAAAASQAADKKLQIKSPDGTIGVEMNIGKSLTYNISIDQELVLDASAMAMTFTDGTVWGKDCKLKKSAIKHINAEISSPFTRQSSMSDNCTELTMQFKDYDVIVRAYNNGVAYRFVGKTKGNRFVKHETVEYNFTADNLISTPYVRNYEEGKTDIQQQFYNSFENTYTTEPISKLNPKRLSFLPLIADLGKGRKMCISETHLENYPGLYLLYAGGNHQLKGVNAPYPKTLQQGGHNMLQLEVVDTEDYIAKVEGARSFPWRIAMISRNDAELAENNLSYLLAAPSRVSDISWIKPGKVAWDWWNDWNITNVDFRAGINNDTYKYYIDFASANGIEYVILDEGWAVNKKADLMQVVPEIDLPMLVDYGRQKNVGIILWAGYYAFERDMENIAAHYSKMGVKGFKIDFMDRDDQIMTDFYYQAAATCARYKLLCDFHGAFKPAGINRTYPNVVNVEGVSGMEQMKWEPTTRDQVTYDCQLPFIRQTSGPMDYTQGAMLNAAKGRYYPSYSEPMSQGTRCRQLALYIIFESPLNMMCDSPTNYLAETECTKLIASIPTVWDETKVLSGEMGKYIVTARRSGDTWYIGGITDWEARDLEFVLPESIDLNRRADLYKDGINADRKATDYKHETINLQRNMKVHLAQGGGFLLEIK
jgi:alpha-glucosidase